MKIEGSVAIITGGASGLGAATAAWLSGRGARVTIFDLDAERGEELAQRLGNGARFAQVDVADDAAVSSAVAATAAASGPPSILVACAGIPTPTPVLYRGEPGPLDSFEDVLRVNLLGTLVVVRHVVAQMAKRTPDPGSGERGVLVLTSSAAAEEGQPGQTAYAASKGGIDAMVLPLARELAPHGIRANVVAPGVFSTPFLDWLPPSASGSLTDAVVFPKRLGEPAEFACAVGAVIENAYVNGARLRVDGGLRLR